MPEATIQQQQLPSGSSGPFMNVADDVEVHRKPDGGVHRRSFMLP
ncbi:MAG: hypothetical protein ACYCO5_09960 [Acidobacteriaceae bacterium]